MFKLQTQISLNTTEAEYIALSQSMREIISIREILREIQTFVMSRKSKKLTKSTVYKDNESCLKFATMTKIFPRTKHIAILYHFFNTKVIEVEIAVIGVSTTDHLAYQFTKGLINRGHV